MHRRRRRQALLSREGAVAGSPLSPLTRGGQPISRRKFVRRSSGLLVAAGFGGACEGTAPGEPLGTIRVNITGLGTGLTSGGSALITRTDVTGFTPLTVPVPVTGTAQADVPAGTYHAVYTPPPGFQVVGGNEFDVTITPQATTTVNVTVAVIVVQGTLRVIVTGLTAAAANGGSAALLRTDIPGQSPVTAPIPLAGQADTVVAAGTYQVTYTPPSGFQVVGTNVFTTTVTSQATSTVTVPVAAIVTQGTLRVTVFGITAAAANAGSASLLRTDIPGQTPIAVPIPLAGQADTLVTVGTYQVTYTPPSGFTLGAGVTNPQTTNVTAGATSTVSFSIVESGGTTPDIYGFGFEDGTSGLFITGSGQPFIPNTEWDLDTTLAARGTNSVKQVYAASGANVGTPFYKTMGGRTSVFVRVMYRQSDPFNKNGSTNNFDQVKLIRLLGPGFSGQLGAFFISNSLNSSPGVLLCGFADLNGNIQRPPNLNLPAPNLNSLLDTWIHIEGHWDISVTNALKFEGWINGVQYFDYTIAASNQGKTFGVVQFDGTINSMQQQSTAWFDEIGISSQRMGIP